MEEQTRDWGFSCIHYGVAAPSPDVRVAFIPLPEREIIRLARKCVQMLAEPLPPVPREIAAKLGPDTVLAAPAVFAQIDIGKYPPLHGRIDRFAQTAAMVTWIHRMTQEVATGRRGGAVQAVSLYLTGIDRTADNCAISACRSLRLGGKGLPVGAGVYDQIANESRPLAVQIFCQSLARMDPSIRCGFLAMGTAFFGTLGVEEATD